MLIVFVLFACGFCSLCTLFTISYCSKYEIRLLGCKLYWNNFEMLMVCGCCILLCLIAGCERGKEDCIGFSNPWCCIW